MKHQQNQPTKVTIIINGRPNQLEQESISYEQLVEIAFPGSPPDSNYKITYAGPKNEEGSLSANGSIELVNGMRFNVSPTGRA